MNLNIITILCMHSCFCVCVCAHMHVIVHAVGTFMWKLEADNRCFPQSRPTLLFWDRIFHWIWNILIQLDWFPVSSRVRLSLPPLHVITHVWHSAKFLCGCWEYKSYINTHAAIFLDHNYNTTLRFLGMPGSGSACL